MHFICLSDKERYGWGGGGGVGVGLWSGQGGSEASATASSHRTQDLSPAVRALRAPPVTENCTKAFGLR